MSEFLNKREYMRLHHYSVAFLLFFFYGIHPIEYIYPIACLTDETILYIHQLSSTSIQLYSWNVITNMHEPMLWSIYNPASVQLLPHNAGFSFIDNGRLRIKSFEKRSPKTIEFDEPIFNINGLQWIDEQSCYCSAQYGNYFSIFQLYDDGRVDFLVHGYQYDCMYPQRVCQREQKDGSLFYIKRIMDISSHEFHYSIEKTEYHKNILVEQILDFYEQPIIFLNMISEKEGFVVGHEKSIDNEMAHAQFHYYHIIKENNDTDWQKKLLFSFIIPTNLFLYDNENRLFESILPLLPQFIEGLIYFVSCSKNKYLEIYCCDMKIKQINKCIAARKGHLFVPVRCRRGLFVGGGTKTNTTYPLFVF